jgi:hypothetical protein
MKSNTSKLCVAWALLAGNLLTNSASALQWSAPNGATEGTKLLYHFDETGTTVVDSSTNLINGTLSNASMRASSPGWLTSPSGYYIQQPTSNADRMTNWATVTGINFNGGLTVSGWLRMRAGETQVGQLFYIETPTQIPRAYVSVSDFGGSGIEARISLTVAGASPGNTTLTAIDANWHHVAVVYNPLDGSSANGGEWRFYLDNVQIGGSLADAKNISPSTQFTLGIGRQPFNNTDRLGGADFDEVIVVNQTMTSFSNPAVGVGVPTLGEWGMILLFALVVIAGWKKLRGAELAPSRS